MTVGERIRQKRIEKGWTQDDLRKRMGYTSRATIHYIESGRNDLTASKLKMIADVLGTTPSELLGVKDRLAEEELSAIEYVCQDEDLKKMLMEFVAKLKGIKDAKESLT